MFAIEKGLPDRTSPPAVSTSCQPASPLACLLTRPQAQVARLRGTREHQRNDFEQKLFKQRLWALELSQRCVDGFACPPTIFFFIDRVCL